MKKIIVFLATLSILFSGITSSFGQTVSDEAKRRFDRGMAAVEMATTPEDYELAINEFQQAQVLAPGWPDVYYNLGLIQEKAGQFKDAASSLMSYLQLVPDSPDAAAIRILANKAEFKAEQVLTDDDVLNILTSLADTNQWQLKGITNANLLPHDWIRSFHRSSFSGYKNRLIFEFYSGSCCPTLKGICPGDALPMAKAVEFQTYFCGGLDGGYMSVFNYRLEVASRNKVKMALTVKNAKEYGGGLQDALFEFIRR